MSARVFLHASFGLFLAGLVAMPATAWPETSPPPGDTQTSAPGGKDEAASAAHESEEQAVRYGDGVAAIVNDSVISNYDVRQRISLFIATSGIRPNADSLKQIKAQVLKQLETERLELIEAEKDKVSVSAAEVDKAIGNIESDNHLSPQQLSEILSHNDVHMETLRAQIAAQIAWSKLVQDQLGDRVHVSQLDVDDEMARLKTNANKPRYLVAEIFQAVDTPEQDAKIRKDMQDLETQLQAGAPFSAVARQFSQNPTAAQGGDLGVVQEGQLPPELDKVLVTMRPGQISQPIRSSGGYYILLLRELQEPEGAKIPVATPDVTYPAGQLPLVRITLPIGPHPSKDLMDRATQAAAVLRAQIQSCTMAKDVAKHLPGTMVTDMGVYPLADLSAEFQSAITQADAGGVTPPLLSPVGVELIVRCDKPVPKIGRWQLPTRDEIEQEIYQEQITTLARQYLRDLRRDADIETR